MLVKKYQYETFDRQTNNDTGKRVYVNNAARMPSVTTILDSTKDKSGLAKWITRVGKEEAERIKNEAAKVGTAMHLTLENHILGTEYHPKDDDEIHAVKMAGKVISEGLVHVNEVWGSEVHLRYGDLYAGTTDLVGLFKGKPTIMDFKQTNKPKRREWIEDYFIQLAAYSEAHKKHHGEIEGGAVLMCSRNLEFQLFEIDKEQLQMYTNLWWDRFNKFKAISKSVQLPQASEPKDEI